MNRPTSLLAQPGPAIGLLLSCCMAPLAAQQSTAEAVATTRTAIEKWVETRGLLSKEASDWRLGKESLAARMDVLRREITSLQQRIADAESSIAEADKRRAELLVENDARKATADGMLRHVAAFEQRTLSLLPRLPDPLRERVKPLSQRLPQGDEASRQSLAERWQNVIGILNEVHKWNREITVTTEVRPQADGSSVEVAVIYLGIGQGYYASANGSVAGIGTAAKDAWRWSPANELAPAVLRAIAILKNEQVAAFVRLPVQIQ